MNKSIMIGNDGVQKGIKRLTFNEDLHLARGMIINKSIMVTKDGIHKEFKRPVPGEDSQWDSGRKTALLQ